MHAVKNTFVALLLTLFCWQQAQANQADDVNQILEETGFDKLIEYIPTFAQSILKQSSGALEPEMNSALSAAFTQAFASEAVKRDVMQTINAYYKADAAQGFLKHLRSPIAKKMGALEAKTRDPAERPAIVDFIKAIQENPLPAKRTALIQRLDTATRTSDFSVDMQAALFKAIFTAIDPVMAEDMRISEDELTKMVNEVRGSLEQNIKRSTQVAYLYAFRDISDEELTRYIEMGESDDYRWGIQLLGNAMILALNQASDRAANQMRLLSVK